VGAIVPVVERERAREALLAPRLVPLPVHPPAVAREPAARAEREPDVHAEPEARRLGGDVLAELADLEHGGDPAAQELGHGEVDARAAGVVVLGAVADGQGLEQPRVEELGAPRVLDERPIERGARDVGVGRDQPGGEDPVPRVHRLVGAPLEGGPDQDDAVALDHHVAVAEQPVAAAVERDDVAGADQGAARRAQERSPSPKSASWRPSGRRMPAMASKSGPPRKRSRASAIGRSCWVT
jgi:hypothetical protein